MAMVVTINRPDVVTRTEALANRLTGGNKTEVVALALRILSRLRLVGQRMVPRYAQSGGAGVVPSVGRAANLCLDGRESRSGSLLGAHLGSLTVRGGVDLTAPILEDAMELARPLDVPPDPRGVQG